MQRSGQKRAHDEICHGLAAKKADDKNVEDDLAGDVHVVDRTKGDLVDHHRPDRIEEQLERAEESLARH